MNQKKKTKVLSQEKKSQSYFSNLNKFFKKKLYYSNEFIINLLNNIFIVLNLFIPFQKEIPRRNFFIVKKNFFLKIENIKNKKFCHEKSKYFIIKINKIIPKFIYQNFWK